CPVRGKCSRWRLRQCGDREHLLASDVHQLVDDPWRNDERGSGSEVHRGPREPRTAGPLQNHDHLFAFVIVNGRLRARFERLHPELEPIETVRTGGQRLMTDAWQGEDFSRRIVKNEHGCSLSRSSTCDWKNWFRTKVLDGQPQQPSDRRRLDAARAVGGANPEDQVPLPEQDAPRVEERERRVVDVGRLRCHAVQLDDGQVLAAAEPIDISIADVEAADVESWYTARDFVDASLELGTPQFRAVEEYRALRMVARDRKRH